VYKRQEKIIRKTFHKVQRVSGTILTDKKGEIAILASSPGIISFSDQFLYPGIKVNMGTNLFTISGADMSKDNPELEYKQLVADYNRARQNFERAERLIEEKLITEEHYLAAKNEFERLSAEYSIYSLSDSSGQRIIKAPKTAYIKEVLVEEGEYVNAGDRLLTVQAESKLILKADIPPGRLDVRTRIKAAKFSCAYSDRIFNTEELNGKLISYGRSGSDDSFYIPLFFRIDFTEELIPGTFADIWLIGEDIKDAIAIPNSAIMEEFGKLYVFIDHEGHFDKRFIEAGESDGQFTHILSGLSESEHVVTQGAYQVKMSMMSSIPNTHQHSH
jgi:RND family efflux transporter MFP subunit